MGGFFLTSFSLHMIFFIYLLSTIWHLDNSDKDFLDCWTKHVNIYINTLFCNLSYFTFIHKFLYPNLNNSIFCVDMWYVVSPAILCENPPTGGERNRAGKYWLLNEPQNSLKWTIFEKMRLDRQKCPKKFKYFFSIFPDYFSKLIMFIGCLNALWSVMIHWFLFNRN